MEKTITKVLNEFKNLSAPARHVNSKYTFTEIEFELNRLKNKLKIYEQDFHQTFEGYKESIKPEILKSTLGFGLGLHEVLGSRL